MRTPDLEQGLASAMMTTPALDIALDAGDSPPHAQQPRSSGITADVQPTDNNDVKEEEMGLLDRTVRTSHRFASLGQQGRTPNVESPAATTPTPSATPSGETARCARPPPRKNVWSMDSQRGLMLSLTPTSGGSPKKQVATVQLDEARFADPLDIHLEGDEDASETSDLARQQKQQQRTVQSSTTKRFYENDKGKRVYRPPPRTQPWRRNLEEDDDDTTYYTTTGGRGNNSWNNSWSNNSITNGSWTGRIWRQNSMGSVVSELSLDKEANSNPAFNLPFDSMAMGKSFRISHKQKEEAFPNNPHPSLECAPLYFFLKLIPNFLIWTRPLYALRWSLCFKLQRRIWLTKSLRKIGLFLTWGELFMLIPFFLTIILGIVYTYVMPDVGITGHLARTPLIFAFLTAQRNSFLTMLLGIPVERAIWYHKFSARIAYFNGLLHTYVAFLHPDKLPNGGVPIHSIDGSQPHFGLFLFQDQVNSGGTMLVIFMSGMILTALPWVRRKAFELFYYVHVVFATCMVICAFYHTGIIVPILAGLVWGGDLFVRKVLMATCRYPRKATLTIISDSVVEVAFPKTKGFDYNPGQYIYIAVPELSWLQWHPFSLSSSPEQKVVTLHIRKAGSWTRKLYALATESPQREVDILFEGPYGSVGVDLMSNRYKMMMLISGGIGVTPMQSMCNQLMYEHSTNQRVLKHLSFIWVERDPVVMQEVDVVRRTSTMHLSARDLRPMDDDCASIVSAGLLGAPPQGIASTLLSMVPQSRATDAEFDAQYPLEEFDDLDDDSDVEYDDSQSIFAKIFKGTNRHAPVSTNGDGVVWDSNADVASGARTNASSKGKIDTTMRTSQTEDDEETFIHKAYNFPGDSEDFRDESERASSEFGALDLQVYLTAKNKTNPGISGLPFVHTGRPDVKSLFRKMKEEAIAKGERRVAVCVCAPLRLVVICRKACAKYSDRNVRFDFHEEVFE